MVRLSDLVMPGEDGKSVVVVRMETRVDDLVGMFPIESPESMIVDTEIWRGNGHWRDQVFC